MSITAQVSSGAAGRLWEVGGRYEEKELQTHQVQQHLLSALHQRLLQTRVQQPRAEGQRRALALHLQQTTGAGEVLRNQSRALLSLADTQMRCHTTESSVSRALKPETLFPAVCWETNLVRLSGAPLSLTS